MTEVRIVPTGTANIASVRAAMSRLGAGVSDASTPREIIDAAAQLGMQRADVERLAQIH